MIPSKGMFESHENVLLNRNRFCFFYFFFPGPGNSLQPTFVKHQQVPCPLRATLCC